MVGNACPGISYELGVVESYAGVVIMLLHRNGKITIGESEIKSFAKSLLSTDPHCMVICKFKSKYELDMTIYTSCIIHYKINWFMRSA